MAVGFPVKDDYATGDVLTAANMNDFAGTLNIVPDTIGAYAAGKNKIINGDFNINQRAFTSLTATNFGFDRFNNVIAGGTGTATFTPQVFTPGAAPVAGYESTNYLRVVTTGQSATSTITRTQQSIEDVRTFAGQTATFSFWAKAATGTPSISVELGQGFGSGGSPSADVTTLAGKVTLSTSWARYSVTVAVPSISGKTLGTTANTSKLDVRLWVSAGSDFNARTGTLGIQSNTFEIWGIQAEAGSIATPFQTASGGSPQAELAMCQRYYWRSTAGSNFQSFASGFSRTTTSAYFNVNNPVAMRIAPTSIDSSTLSATNGAGSGIATTAVILTQAGALSSLVEATVASGLTIGQGSVLLANNSASAYIALNAEL
jgi:hypothetical protein